MHFNMAIIKAATTKVTEVATPRSTEVAEADFKLQEVATNQLEVDTQEQAGEVTTTKVKLQLQLNLKEGVGYTSQRGANASNGGQNADKWCSNCKKPTHNTAQCWTKNKVNPVEGEEQKQPQNQQEQNNDRDPDFEEVVHSFYQTKN